MVHLNNHTDNLDTLPTIVAFCVSEQNQILYTTRWNTQASKTDGNTSLSIRLIPHRYYSCI